MHVSCMSEVCYNFLLGTVVSLFSQLVGVGTLEFVQVILRTFAIYYSSSRIDTLINTHFGHCPSTLHATSLKYSQTL